MSSEAYSERAEVVARKLKTLVALSASDPERAEELLGQVEKALSDIDEDDTSEDTAAPGRTPVDSFTLPWNRWVRGKRVDVNTTNGQEIRRLVLHQKDCAEWTKFVPALLYVPKASKEELATWCDDMGDRLPFVRACAGITLKEGKTMRLWKPAAYNFESPGGSEHPNYSFCAIEAAEFEACFLASGADASADSLMDKTGVYEWALKLHDVPADGTGSALPDNARFTDTEDKSEGVWPFYFGSTSDTLKHRYEKEHLGYNGTLGKGGLRKDPFGRFLGRVFERCDDKYDETGKVLVMYFRCRLCDQATATNVETAVLKNLAYPCNVRDQADTGSGKVGGKPQWLPKWLREGEEDAPPALKPDGEEAALIKQLQKEAAGSKK